MWSTDLKFKQYKSPCKKICTLSSLKDVPKEQWNALIGDHFPFLEYDFLRALEVSASVGLGSGWLPHYFVQYNKQNRIVGAIPLYLKSHSYGEYIFDWSWINIARQLGKKYFPKLVVAIPFTPATGQRILIHPEEDYDAIASNLISHLLKFAQKAQASSIHWLFVTRPEQELLQKHDFLPRYTYQFHWHNNNYQSFSHYLEMFSSKKRNQIKRERARANQGTEIELLTGTDIQPQHWEIIYRLYLSTISRKWAHDYLQEEFFKVIAKTFPHQTILVMAKKNGKYIAGTLNFQKGDHLYGRYWGCLEKHPCLHFELCYYRLIEYSIQKSIKIFEAGAQGEQKIPRGFLARDTYSAHWITDPLLREIIREFLDYEKISQQEAMEVYQQLSPFKKGSNSE